MTPEMWLELLPILHSMRNLPQFAKIPQGMHGVALLLLYGAFSRSTLEDGCRLSSCGLVPRLGWAPEFLVQASFASREAV